MAQSLDPSRTRSTSFHIPAGQRSRTRNDITADSTGDPRLLRTRSVAGQSLSTRSADLSHRVNRVEEGIDTIKGQLQQIIGLRQPHSTTSTPRQQREPCHRPPSRYLDFERELQRAEPQFDTQKGKDTIRDFYVNNPIPRPYMFLQGPGFRTPKDKAAHRDKMSFHEYVLAFTNMLKDKRACTQEDWPELVAHLNQVACDAQSRQWENVRAWSDHVFTRIESGDINWSAKDEIQFDRMRLSLAPDSRPLEKLTSDNATAKQVVCSDFNARRCKHRDNHVEVGITFLHVCAWCHAALGNRNPHTVVKCENKIRFAQDRPHAPQHTTQAPPRPYSQQNMQHQQPFQPAQYQQQPRRQVFTSAVIHNQQQTTKPKNDA